MEFKIGAFKTLTGLSEGTLRYYEKLGLISPDREEGNDYRRYGAEDFLALVQIKQLTGFHIPLTELLEGERLSDANSMHDLLVSQRTALEAKIEDLYERIARIKLHETHFRKIIEEDTRIERANIRGIYRLFISDEAVFSHPETPRIAARWLANMPYAHATVRIRLEELTSGLPGPYGVQLGIGMLERYFMEAGETFREPMQYSPPQSSINGMIFVKDLESIGRAELAPFLDYFEENKLIPVEDMYGWIVYASRTEGAARYCVSLRVAVA